MSRKARNRLPNEPLTFGEEYEDDDAAVMTDDAGEPPTDLTLEPIEQSADGTIIGDYDPDKSAYRPPLPSWRSTPSTQFIDRVAAALPFRTLRRTALELVWVPQGRTYQREPYAAPGDIVADAEQVFADYGRSSGLRVLRIRDVTPNYTEFCRASLPAVRLDIDQVRIQAEECEWLGTPNLNCSLPIATGMGPQLLLICTYEELDDRLLQTIVKYAVEDGVNPKIKDGDFTPSAWKAICESIDRSIIRRVYAR